MGLDVEWQDQSESVRRKGLLQHVGVCRTDHWQKTINVLFGQLNFSVRLV